MIALGGDVRRKLSSRRIAEIVAEELRRQIIDGELVDGDLLPRQDILVRRFNVSLVSVREALRILETEGLLSVRRGNQGGAVVHAPARGSAAYMLGLVLQRDSVPLSDLGLAIQELEPCCAALAAARPDRESRLMPELRGINESMAVHLRDEVQFTELGRRFHDAIGRGCGNSTLLAVMESLEALWTSHERRWAERTEACGAYPSLTQRRAVLDVHAKLAQAIEAGDAGRAHKLATRHVIDTQSRVIADDPGQRIQAPSLRLLSQLRP